MDVKDGGEATFLRSRWFRRVFENAGGSPSQAIPAGGRNGRGSCGARCADGGRRSARTAAVIEFPSQRSLIDTQADGPALAEICRRYGVKELSLFGSAVRGEMGPESDLDVLVEFESGVRRDRPSSSRSPGAKWIS